MYKFIAILSNTSNSIEEQVFENPETIELDFHFYPGIDEILSKLEPIVHQLKKGKEISISIEIIKESGDTIFLGTATGDGRLHGTSMSI